MTILRRALPHHMLDELRRRRTRARYLIRDAKNVLRYGGDAPLSAALICVDPRTIDLMLVDVRDVARDDTGTVRAGDWDKRVVHFDEHPKVVACVERFEHGVSWEATGIVDRLLVQVRTDGHTDGYRSLDEIIERYRAIDRLHEQLRSGGGFMTRRQLIGGRAFREQGGVYVHIDRHTRPVFGLGGFHRLALARILGLERIPAQLGVVHSAAVRSWRTRYATR